jgi:hypothetical protein
MGRRPLTVAAVLWAVALTLVACGVQPSPSATAGRASASASAAATNEPTPQPLAEAWENVTDEAMGETADWSNKVELADINEDGAVDLLFANGGDYDTPGSPVASTVFTNDGDGTFTDATASVMGDLVALTRVIKAADLDADGHLDLIMGTTFQTQSQLLLGRGEGTFSNVTRDHLPQVELSVGDLEVGDVDADGDLDIVLAHWGDGNPFDSRGKMQLWLNDGSAHFTDATDRVADALVGFSWELELIDVDNDWDLDAAISCKVCTGSFLLENDGTGVFTDVTDGRLPAYGNNYEFTPVDLDRDGYLDLVTINDGPETGHGASEHVFRNDGAGTFEDVTEDWWPEATNSGYDDNMAVALDVDSDGDADFFVASLDGPDRLLLNDGSGRLTAVVAPLYAAAPSRGTLGWAVADLNGDDRPDLVESQGENPAAEAEQVYLATDAVPPDTAPPIIATDLGDDPAGHKTVRARIHDNRTPNMPHDWRSVVVQWDGGEPVPMIWYGENLFRAEIQLPAGATNVRVCAVDGAGNETCAP